jgi:methylthioribose-1-phosphate isomerase
VIAPLRWEDGVLLILDQTRLPGEEIWLRCDSPAQVADAIARLAVRGAPAIGVAAAYGLALAQPALAATGFGTALGVIEAAWRRGGVRQVWVGETRPLNQGSRLTAWELAQSGIPFRVITDSSAGHLMSSGQIDRVVVGADRIAANGDVANKIGTYALAVLARHHDIPFIVAAPTSTVDPGTATGADIPIEERDPSEVSPEGFPAANFAFDVTPAGLVTALVTEEGVTIE